VFSPLYFENIFSYHFLLECAEFSTLDFELAELKNSRPEVRGHRVLAFYDSGIVALFLCWVFVNAESRTAMCLHFSTFGIRASPGVYLAIA